MGVCGGGTCSLEETPGFPQAVTGCRGESREKTCVQEHACADGHVYMPMCMHALCEGVQAYMFLFVLHPAMLRVYS